MAIAWYKKSELGYHRIASILLSTDFQGGTAEDYCFAALNSLDTLERWQEQGKPESHLAAVRKQAHKLIRKADMLQRAEAN